MKQHDLYDPLVIRARYANPNVGELDLPEATPAVLIMRREGDAEPTLDRADIEITDVTDGVVTFTREWEDGDTDVAGKYRLEIELDMGGKPLTIPTNGHIPFEIEADLG